MRTAKLGRQCQGMVSKTVRSHGWRSQAYTDVFTACFGNHALILPSAPKSGISAIQQDTDEAPSSPSLLNAKLLSIEECPNHPDQ